MINSKAQLVSVHGSWTTACVLTRRKSNPNLQNTKTKRHLVATSLNAFLANSSNLERNPDGDFRTCGHKSIIFPIDGANQVPKW
jgi:hypothetical protein